MARTTLRLLVAVVLVVVFAACGDSPTGVLALDEADNGATVAVQDETLIEITLAANPSTGYSWSVIDTGDDVLRQVGDPTFEAGSDLVGAAGLMTIAFECINPGVTTLELAYQHPWLDDEPLRTFAVTVLAG